ncbi:MAG: hypothetical protein ABIJ24_03175 [Nitrospinota bacterium]
MITEIGLDAIAIRIMGMSAKEIQYCLDRNMFSARERPYFEEYLPHKIEEERNAPVTMYHRRKATDGKIFKAYEVSTLKKGWVDSPDKFSEGIISKIKRIIINPIWVFWCKEYKWILGFIATLIALYLTYIKLTTTK